MEFETRKLGRMQRWDGVSTIVDVLPLSNQMESWKLRGMVVSRTGATWLVLDSISLLSPRHAHLIHILCKLRGERQAFPL